MPVKVEADGRRWTQASVDVPGTPEEIWQAIATGPGVTSWFVPCTMEEREGGKVVSTFGPGMDAVATITKWDPPHSFAAEGEMAPGSPLLAIEWLIEAKAGGMSTVRVVHSLFTSSEDWDDQLNGMEQGWPTFFTVLRTYLEEYRGQKGTNVAAMAISQSSFEDVWRELSTAFGVDNAKVGERVESPAGAPRLAGTLQSLGHEENRWLNAVIHLSEPAPGCAIVSSQSCHGPVMAHFTFYVYGDEAAATMEREGPKWQEWLAEKFPAPKAMEVDGSQ
jgi:uncharacterized protein YndB with AHSA1/START domain